MFLFSCVPYNVFPNGNSLGKGDAVGEFFSKAWDGSQAVALKKGIKCVHQPVIKAPHSMQEYTDCYDHLEHDINNSF